MEASGICKDRSDLTVSTCLRVNFTPFSASSVLKNFSFFFLYIICNARHFLDPYSHKCFDHERNFIIGTISLFHVTWKSPCLQGLQAYVIHPYWALQRSSSFTACIHVFTQTLGLAPSCRQMWLLRCISLNFRSFITLSILVLWVPFRLQLFFCISENFMWLVAIKDLICSIFIESHAV